jgi:RIO-like serine/threonine protein kinase
MISKKVYKVLTAIKKISDSEESVFIQLISELSGLSIKKTIETMKVCASKGLIKTEEICIK